MTADFLWRQPAPPTRGPKPALTLDRIADAAIAVADAEGLAAVSMQRVAAELGYTKMSLYRYLPGKAELVAAMLERGMGEPPAIGAAPGWRAGLTTWARALLAAFGAHAWAPEATTGARAVGPRELAWTERALGVLPEGLTGAERLDLVATVAGHVRMIAGQGGRAEGEFAASMSQAMAEHADEFPALAAALAGVAAHGGADQAFSFGLERILDGVEVLIRSRERTGRRQV